MQRLSYFLYLAVIIATALDVCRAQSTGLLKVGNSNRCMATTRKDNFANGAHPRTLKCVPGAAAHTWTYKSTGVNGMYNLVTAENKCLDLPDGRAYNGAQMQIWDCVSGNSNQFFVRDGNNFRWNGSPYCLDVRDGLANGFSSHLAIQIWDCILTSPNQSFSGPSSSSSATVTTTTTLAKVASTSKASTSSTSAKSTSKAVLTTSTSAKSTSKAVLTTSTSAKSTSKAVLTTSTTAKPTSNAISTTSTSAKSTSKAVLTTSTSAKSTSNAIFTTSTTAKSTSKAVLTTSTSAKSTSTSLRSTSTFTTLTKATSSSSTTGPHTTTVTSTVVLPTFSSVAKPALTSIFKPNAKRMLPWGYNDYYAASLGVGPKISTYHHWQLGVVSQMPSNVTYIPTYWGTSMNSSWINVQSQFTKIPGAIMGFNEPDVASQANMSPSVAAWTFYQNLTLPYGRKGANLISPSMAWYDTAWMTPFLAQCASLGCGIDALGMHFYVGINNNTAAAVNYICNTVETVYAAYGLPLVLGEVGLTSAGGGSAEDMVDFLQGVGHCLDNSDAVLGWGLSAVFAQGNGWDNYLNSNLAFFYENSTITPLAQMYMYDDF